MLIETLVKTSQARWCHYLAERPDKKSGEICKDWLEMEWREAVVQRQSVLGAQYQQGTDEKF